MYFADIPASPYLIDWDWRARCARLSIAGMGRERKVEKPEDFYHTSGFTNTTATTSSRFTEIKDYKQVIPNLDCPWGR
jgi:hypothetical protein